jgi:hypothetical protein
LPCDRNLAAHCCWLKGETCSFLRDNGAEQNPRWTCTLREALGNWEAVHQDARYLQLVQPTWLELGIKDCGDYSCENCIDGNT